MVGVVSALTVTNPTVDPTNPLVEEKVTICAEVSEIVGDVIVSLNCDSPQHTIISKEMNYDEELAKYCSWFNADVEDAETMSCQITAEDNNGPIGPMEVPEFTYDGKDPVANAGEDQEVEVGDVVYFDGSGSSDTVTATEDLEYYWDFDDGETSDLQSPTHVYDTEGEYEITLTVTDEAKRESAPDPMTVEVVADTAPTAKFSWKPLNPNEGEEVEFTDESESHDPIVSWAWDFGDGGISDLRNPKHTFPDNGIYDVTLTVADSEDSVSVTKQVKVKNIAPWNVNAGGPYKGVINEEIEFSGSADDVEADEDKPLVYEWDCDYDGDFDVDRTGKNPTCTYPESKTYTVALRVNDGDDYSEIVTAQVVIYNYQIELSEGWNLFSIPLVPENDDTSINAVLGEVSSDAYVIWAYVYDEETGKNVWKYNTPDSDGWNVDRTLQNIIPGYGYYIKMNNEVIAYNNGGKMYGNSDDEDEWNVPKPPVVTLTPSWNLVGHYGMNTDVSKEEALDTLGESYSTMLDMDGNPISDETSLNPTQGYWLFVTGTDNLDYAPSEEAYSKTV